MNKPWKTRISPMVPAPIPEPSNVQVPMASQKVQEIAKPSNGQVPITNSNK